ncbi:MAG: FAD:protein FMN transferase [Clostridiaceae bacterium]|nr:FAD:protein FMN transferase [Clostridiaceae bacterium]
MKTMKTKGIILILCLLMLLSTGCAQNKTYRYQAEFLQLFDTVTQIVGYSDSKEHFSEFAEQVRAKLEEYHRLYDIYDNYEGINNIKTINDNAGVAPVKVDISIIDMLLFARAAYKATGGKVNVAFGSVLSIWHDYRESGLDNPESAQLPPMEQLTEAAKHTSIDDMIIDEAASTVYLSDPLMKLDVGAVAKGYAVEQVVCYFESQGVTSLLLSVGGNVKAVGEKAETDMGSDNRWVIGIQNPDQSSDQAYLMRLAIKGISVVSSGNYERYYVVNGVRYHHIIDPETLFPSDYYAQVTILCRNSGLGDALSTAVFNMPLDAGRAYIESLSDVEAVWVMKDGSVEYSEGFEDFDKYATVLK